jgi:Fur family zinc uptake transcriptional regulator
MTHSLFPTKTHNHDACRKDALAHAQRHLAASKARLTPDRQAVLEVLLDSHRAQGAYDIMEQIDWRGRRPAPAVIYRALDFLVSHGLAHKIESLNAFMACPHADHAHKPMIMICRDCTQVAEFEAPGIGRAISKVAKDTGFVTDQTTVEVTGQCGPCAARSAA